MEILEEIVTSLCERNKFTKNQKMILLIAVKNPLKWITTAGMCNCDGWSGRGLHFSLKRLQTMGLIQVKPYTLTGGAKHRHSFIASDELVEIVEKAKSKSE